ncbi:MAG TPA: hypothetical protein VMU99_07720, partial [Acidimicrobiales bacterium]|nr:hypothetical protein [Acidimicrobiales bacterium]
LLSGARAAEVSSLLDAIPDVEVFSDAGSSPAKKTEVSGHFLVRARTTEELCRALEQARARGHEVRIEVDPSSI